MATNRIQIQNALHKTYDRLLFAKEVLSPIFGSAFTLNSNLIEASVLPNQSEAKIIDKVYIYGKIDLEDGTEVTCYEILLHQSIRIEQSKVAIQRYVRKLLTAGQASLVNFITPSNPNIWRLTLVAKDSALIEGVIKEKITHSKRYTYLLGPSESCKTAAERFETLSTEKVMNFDALVKAFSVEKLSRAFFDEYTIHYTRFVDSLTSSKYKKSVFKNDEKAIRDFSKKLLGRIVFLYFVQKKGWLGASNTKYNDGIVDFMMHLFMTSGANDDFYPAWLSVLFFETLNKERKEDNFKMPNGKVLKIPFLNGGLFDKEEHDDNPITFKSILFHNPNNPDDPKHRGFLDFLNAFNFTVHEDSPDDHTVAVDPEMLGHIFENLLEDNKDKGAFYTPKEIVHYMCQESLIEYLTTHLSKDYTIYRQITKEQIELFGNETRIGQLKMIEELGDRGLNRDDIELIVKFKDITKLTKQQLIRMKELLDSVKICDPAIGSGAFPMGLLQEIYAIKEVISYETNTDWSPARVKEDIIQNSIYGVDVEKGAVDIARLRFWLSLVVDEVIPKPLPNLDYKIVVGDSLLSKFQGEVVEIDWSNDVTKDGIFAQEFKMQNIELLKLITQKQREYFHPELKNKKKLSKEIRNLKLDILLNQIELTIKTKGLETKPSENSKKLKEQTALFQQTKEWKKIISNLQTLKSDAELPFEHFDWKLDFPEILNPYLVGDKGGFDILIGNPPYVQIKQIPEKDKSHYVDNYEFATGRFNLFYFFLELSKKLTTSGGVTSYIIPDRILLNTQCIEIRNWLLNEQTITEIDSFDESVFENAVVDSIIISYLNQPNNVPYIFSRPFLKVQDLKERNKIKIPTSHFISSPNKQFDLSYSEVKSKVIELIRKDSVPLGDITETKDGIIQSKIPDVLFLKKKENAHCKKLLFGKDVDKYRIEFNDNWVNYQPEKMMEIEIERGGGGLRLRNKGIFEKVKILTRQTSDHIVGTIDYDNYYYSNTLHGTSIVDEKYDIRYILALLNSKVINYYYRATTSEGGKVFAQIKIEILRQLPIKYTDKQSELNTFIDYILFLKSQTLNTVEDQLMPNYFEQIIDGIVYELYFKDQVQKYNREIIKHLGDIIPFQSKMTDEDKMKIIRGVFKRLDDKNHAVRTNLFYMDSIPEISIIEGR